MRAAVKNYSSTTVHWGKTQSDIMKLLAANGIRDTQFSTISAETTAKSGLMMEPNTVAILLTFQREEQLTNGVGGMVPVRILVPNVPESDRHLNQYYRLLYWYLKSKFEAIQTGLVEFAEEFMPHLQIADKSGFGRLWDKFRTGYYQALSSGQQPSAQLLPPVIQPTEDDE